MALKPEVSLGMALATGTIVWGINQAFTPSVADIRSLDKNNGDVQSAERAATWLSAAVVAGVSLLAKDPTIFIVGGAMTVALAWSTRHADQVDSVTKRASTLMNPLEQVGATPSDVSTLTVEKTPGLQVGGYSTVF